jgi:hypothetical protein
MSEFSVPFLLGEAQGQAQTAARHPDDFQTTKNTTLTGSATYDPATSGRPDNYLYKNEQNRYKNEHLWGWGGVHFSEPAFRLWISIKKPCSLKCEIEIYITTVIGGTCSFALPTTHCFGKLMRSNRVRL